MDAGLSHDPRAIPMYLRVLNEGNEVAFGSRFIKDGSMGDSPLNRRMLSKAGTYLSQLVARH
jgi:dolichol-phosphate mannosyltransferase